MIDVAAFSENKEEEISSRIAVSIFGGKSS
jgi:hypothetical protein